MRREDVTKRMRYGGPSTPGWTRMDGNRPSARSERRGSASGSKGEKANISMSVLANSVALGTTILDRVGHTPLLRLEGLSARLEGVQILGKAEWANPGGSVKDRAASAIVADAQARGLLGRRQGSAGCDQRQYGHRLCHVGRGAGLSGDAVRAVECVAGAEEYPGGVWRRSGVDRSGGWLRWGDPQGA